MTAIKPDLLGADCPSILAGTARVSVLGVRAAPARPCSAWGAVRPPAGPAFRVVQPSSPSTEHGLTAAPRPAKDRCRPCPEATLPGPGRGAERRLPPPAAAGFFTATTGRRQTPSEYIMARALCCSGDGSCAGGAGPPAQTCQSASCCISEQGVHRGAARTSARQEAAHYQTTHSHTRMCTD